MKNMKVSYKLIVSFLIVVILATTVGVVGIIGMLNINEAKTTMYYSKTVPLPHIGKAEGELQYIRVNVREMYISSLSGDQAGVEESWRYIEAMVPKLKAELDNFEDAATDAEALGFYQKARQTYDNQLTPVVVAIRDAARAGDFDTIERKLGECRTYSNQIIDDFERAIDSLIGAAKDSYQEADTMANMMLTIIIVVLVIAVVASMGLAFYISSLIAKPLGIMAGAFSAIGARGSLTFDAVTTKAIHDTVQRKDELGDCARGFEGIIEHLGEIERNLVDIASGDLTAEVHILSDEDDIGKSLQSTLDNLNTMFADITSASGQVSTGSKQIADGAQSLAQGSTEQAASVEELSASIGEIAQKTKENAGMAERAALLAGTIMQNAERGNAQMGDMTDAVKEINQASQSISKVIKVIDDIAFQTNILALNAAVEAARAGQHGKGFAVVAEEVRNLAAKSAEAAKDTGGLIQNSMEKAELGARIAGETAESLAEIVSGINESSQIVGEIAKSSEEQSLGIAQINTGIDQVAQVVQQNSATAEQSAAASEQMSSQSSMLEDLISQFKLKNKGFGPSLPAKKPAAKEYSPPAEDSSYDMHGSDDFGKY